MNRRRLSRINHLLGRLGFALAAAAVLTCSALAQSPASAPTAQARFMPNLKESLETVREQHGLPAVAAAVLVERASRPRQAAAAATGTRLADGDERVTSQDKFHIGSCTKAMTATLLATLVEEGKLQWTSTLAEIFPDLKDKLKPEHQAVTLEQLLQHRSGLPDDRADIPLILRMRQLTGPLTQQRRELVTIAFKHHKLNPPGEFAYSNAGYIVAAAMAEQVTGQPWEDLMQQRLFKPLGIESAGYGPPGTPDAEDQPRGHRAGASFEPGPEADNPACLGPAGTVHLPIEDWLKFAAAHFDGARGKPALRADGKPFLQAETFRRMHTPPPGGDYALGWAVYGDPATGRLLQHAGSNSMWMAIIQIEPEEGRVMLFATNSGEAGANTAGMDLLEKLASESD